MRILTYKRTHTGDPASAGVFGVNDCMGSVRALEYDAVIGVGGIGAEPRSYQIDGKITWVGVSPQKRMGQWPSPLVTFNHFVLFDAGGPALAALAPALAKRVYEGKVRYILSGYTNAEQLEAEEIVKWALSASEGVVGSKTKNYRGVRIRCVCNTPRLAGNASAKPESRVKSRC
jgi:hypothetical protein